MRRNAVVYKPSGKLEKSITALPLGWGRVRVGVINLLHACHNNVTSKSDTLSSSLSPVTGEREL